MATPLVLAASNILYRSSKKEKQTTKITYHDKKPLKTVITTVFSGLLVFVFSLWPQTVHRTWECLNAYTPVV